MEFWGVEVKSGEPLRVESGDGFIVHLSQACLGEAKKDKGNESVCLFVRADEQKLVLGTLSHEKFPQISFDLVFEKDFELSHNLKNGSVFFSGYKVAQPESDSDDFDSDSEEDLPVPVDNGKQEAKPSKPEKDNAAKIDSKQKVKIVEPNKDVKPELEDDDSSDEDDDSSADGESSDDQAMIANGEDEEDESSEDDEDESSEDDEDDGNVKTPKKAEVGKKRSAESASKTPVPDKKAKFVTPQKTDLKKVGGHTATPHPSKQAAKSSANSQKKEQTQKSFTCNACNRAFGSDNALQSHTKAKHGAA